MLLLHSNIKVFATLLFALASICHCKAKDLYYDFTISYISGTPDGVLVSNILAVNGQYPAPTIRGNVGDRVHVTVRNLIQSKEEFRPLTTIHWHGLFQNGTPFEDGPQMVTQCGIANLNSMVYSFELKQSGTYWYHSHTNWQLTEGFVGPLIVTGTPELYGQDYDGELVITLSDWYHTTGIVNINWFLSPASGGTEPIPFSNLLNGKGKYPCNATNLPCFPLLQQPPVFEVQRGKRYRIRVINTSAFSSFFFSIPGHSLEVIEVDGIDTVRGNIFDRVPIAAAQRYSFIVNMNAAGDKHWIVAESDLTMFGFGEPNINPNPEAMIPIVYGKLLYTSLLSPILPIIGGGSLTWPPQPQPEGNAGIDEFNEMSLTPADGILAPSGYDQQVVLDVDQFVDDAGVNHLTFNDIVYTPPTTEPLITMAIKNETFPVSANVVTVKHLDIVQIVLNNHDTGPHPFHLHGHAFFVLGKGDEDAGDYDPASDQLVLDGVKRDTVTVQTGSWIVLRFVADNPGVWFFHCHIHWHLEGGLAMVFNEAPEVLQSELTIPDEAKRVCKAVGIEV